MTDTEVHRALYIQKEYQQEYTHMLSDVTPAKTKQGKKIPVKSVKMQMIL